MKILDKYLFREMVFPFIYGFLIILILVWGNIVYSYLNLIVSRINVWYLILNFLLCKLPSSVLISLAAGGIFGVCIGLNRIIKDSEMTAIKSGGISSIRIFISLMIFGLFISFIGYIFQEIIVVASENKAFEIEKILYEIPGDLPIEPDVFVKSGEYSIYVNSIERYKGDIIYTNIQLYRIQGKFPVIITADKAKENNGWWILENGFVSSFNQDGSPKVVSKFKTLKLEINADNFANYINPTGTEKAHSARELLKMINLRKKASLNAEDLELEYHFKLAFPLSTFIILFCLVPLCLLVPMKSNAIGMVLGIVVFFIYWNIMWFSKILGETGGISPLLSGWSIVIIFGIFGLILSLILIRK